MAHILVTGGAGFIGSNFVHYIKKNFPDYKVTVLDSLTYAGSVDNLITEMRELEHPLYRFWYGDVLNADLVDTLVREATHIVHFAAETHVTRSIFDNRLFFQTDVLGTQTIANAVLKYRESVERFIHISTSEVYGSAETKLMSEEHPLNPMSPYASAKCGADRLVYSYWATYKLPVTIIRPFNNFGPRQHLEKVIPRFITSVIMEESLTLHGKGDSARDFVHVDDTSRAIDAVIHAEDDLVNGEVFNVASGVDRPIKEIAANILNVMDANYASKILYSGDRPGQVLRHTGDYQKINQVLGWSPTVSWEQGIADTIRWYKENASWWEKDIWMRHIPIKTADGTTEFH